MAQEIKAEECKRITRILDMIIRITKQPKHYLRYDLARYYEISERQIDKDLQIIRHGLKMSLLHNIEGYYFNES